MNIKRFLVIIIIFLLTCPYVFGNDKAACYYINGLKAFKGKNYSEALSCFEQVKQIDENYKSDTIERLISLSTERLEEPETGETSNAEEYYIQGLEAFDANDLKQAYHSLKKAQSIDGTYKPVKIERYIAWCHYKVFGEYDAKRSEYERELRKWKAQLEFDKKFLYILAPIAAGGVITALVGFSGSNFTASIVCPVVGGSIAIPTLTWVIISLIWSGKHKAQVEKYENLIRDLDAEYGFSAYIDYNNGLRVGLCYNF